MTDNKNLNLWNKVSRVPGEHLKPFNNGKFAGTAIKPLWFTKTMTEMFGPCGTGWFIDKPEYQLVDAGESKMVYCTLGVWVKDGQRVYGVGGDFAVRNGKGDDEAFKKAYTDALTNALVKFGVAADVHMGLWDGNKYVEQKPEPETPPASPMTPRNANGTPAQPLKRDEARKIFTELKAELLECNTDAEVMAWERASKTRIDLLGDWKVHIENAVTEHRQAIAEAQGKAA